MTELKPELVVETAGGLFQIRPHKDFAPSKGKDRLLSLRLLSEIPLEDVEDSVSSLSATTNSGPTNAYDFMRRRRDIGIDPTLKRWNASIRLANFASADSSPLCVGLSALVLRDDVLIWKLFRFHPLVHCLITSLESAPSVTLMGKVSRVWTSEILSLCHCECSDCCPHSIYLTESQGVLHANQRRRSFVCIMRIAVNMTKANWRVQLTPNIRQ